MFFCEYIFMKIRIKFRNFKNVVSKTTLGTDPQRFDFTNIIKIYKNSSFQFEVVPKETYIHLNVLPTNYFRWLNKNILYQHIDMVMYFLIYYEKQGIVRSRNMHMETFENVSSKNMIVHGMSHKVVICNCIFRPTPQYYVQLLWLCVALSLLYIIKFNALF